MPYGLEKLGLLPWEVFTDDRDPRNGDLLVYDRRLNRFVLRQGTVGPSMPVNLTLNDINITVNNEEVTLG